MAARCVLRAAATGLLDRSGTLPRELGRLVEGAAAGGRDDAWALLEELEAAALQEYGPPAYSPLAMPGWELPGR
jgi:hypothetical protein